MKSLEQYRGLAAQDSNCIAWLRVIRQGESSQNDDAYTELYGGSHFSGFADHPNQRFDLPGGNYTTAAGAYQITHSTWLDFRAKVGPVPFTSDIQDACALWLTDRAGALDDVIAGRLSDAIARCTRVWTSLAIAKRQAEAPEIFAAYGGTPAASPRVPAPPQPNPQIQPAPPAQKVKPMPAALFAFLPQLLSAIPALANLFGSGSEVSNRNIAAAQIVGDTLVKATQAVNLQDAVEKIQGDPSALQAATEAVHEILPQLLDVGGGVETARKFVSDHENTRYGRVLEIVTYAGLVFLLLANVAAFTFAWKSDDFSVMSDLKQADIGVAMIVFGFWLGTSISSKRKDEIKGAQ
jgi:muramidase (phage lysozyme)